MVKIKGRGRSGYFDGSGNYGGCGVKCGLKTGLYAQTSGSGLVKDMSINDSGMIDANVCNCMRMQWTVYIAYR